MYYYNHNDKDDPNKINFDANQLFGQSFEDLNTMNDNNNPFLNFDSHSHSLPSQAFSLHGNDTSSGLDQQDFLLSQLEDYNINNNGGSFNFFDSNNQSNKFGGDIDPTNIFLEDPQQQAILLSDPNFLRQQQLLQNQQQKANKIMTEQQQQQQHSIPIRSNLSAMFSDNNNNSNTYNTNDNNKKESSLSPQIEPINLITSQQQKKDIINSQNRRSISGKISKPIPISSSLPSNSSSSNSGGGIDHQRRFNELQARFRINYAKKPTKQQQQQQQQQSDVTGSSFNSDKQHPLSSSFTDGITVTSTTSTGNRRKLSLDPTSSKPLLRVNSGKIKVVGGGNLNSKSPTNPTTSTIYNNGMTIPTNNNSNTSTSSNSAASSFPSRTMPIQIQRVHRANASQPFDLEQRQKRLDDQLIKVDFNDITVSELKEMLRQRGKPATGKKAILLQRLQEEKDMIIHARANGIPISNRYAIQQQQQPILEGNSPVMPSPIMDHPASLPDTMYLSSSPSNSAMGGIGSLNRSIADMHIGSPPITSQQSRRFAPYATSPRAATISSPQISHSSVPFSSSVPTGSLDMMMMQQHQQQQQQQQQQIKQEEQPRVMRGFNFNKKSYAPFASSALATPDRDDDHNPFDDDVKRSNMDGSSTTGSKDNAFDSPNDMEPNDMEWTDPSLDLLLQQNSLNTEYNDELMAFLASQGLDPNDDFLALHGNMDENNFQNLNGGPDPSSVMFDGLTKNTGNNHLF